MSAKHALMLLALIGASVFGLVAALAWRLDPCLPVGEVCLGPGVEHLCRLFAAAGVSLEPTRVGQVFLALTLGLPLIAIVATVRRWVRTHRFVRSIRSRRVQQVPPRLIASLRAEGLDGQVDLVDFFQPLAFVYGFLRPRIVVTTDLVERLDRLELEAVLRHERVHLLRRDPLWILFGDGLGTMLAWLPLARDLAAHQKIAGEVEADALVARHPGHRVALAGALSKILGVSPESGFRGAYAISGVSATERRIDALLAGQARLSFAASRSGTALSALLLLIPLCLLAL